MAQKTADRPDDILTCEDNPGIRDKQGRFVKGKSGNPRGRPGLPADLRKYGKQAPHKLFEIAMDDLTPAKVRAEIWKWFGEMTYGKPTQQVDMEANVTSAPVAVTFEGVLDEWSK